MEGFSLKDIADTIRGELSGNPEIVIKRILTLEEAGPGDMSVVFDAKSLNRLPESRASAFVIPFGVHEQGNNIIRVENPRRALIELLNLFHPRPLHEALVHSRAVVSPKASVGPGVSIGAGAFVAAEVVIARNAEIHPNVYVGEGCKIGEESEIFPNVTIYPGTRIGKRVRIHSGTVIGSDGFGYMQFDSDTHEKIPQVGDVEIEDDVEIGANCTIDRATLGTTHIRAGTKIDNLVQIGHNSDIGQHCILVAQVGISGSVRMGNRCILAGQVGVQDHVEIKDDAVVGAQSGVAHDLGPGKWLGYPAIPLTRALRAYHLVGKLPEIRREIRELKKRFEALEKQVEDIETTDK